jgi:hypothetical protein
MKPMQWIAPALAIAIGLVPAMAVEQQPGGEGQAQEQQQEMTPIDQQRLTDLQQTGTLLIVDLDAPQQDQAAVDDALTFEEAWQDRSLQEDVDPAVRYVVFYSKEADQQQRMQKEQAARQAFQEAGFDQINYFVLTEGAIEELQKGREQAQAGEMGAEDELGAVTGEEAEEDVFADVGAREDESKVKQHKDYDPAAPNDKRVAGKSPEGKAGMRGDQAQIETEDDTPYTEKRVAGRSPEGKGDILEPDIYEDDLGG